MWSSVSDVILEEVVEQFFDEYIRDFQIPFFKNFNEQDHLKFLCFSYFDFLTREMGQSLINNMNKPYGPKFKDQLEQMRNGQGVVLSLQ